MRVVTTLPSATEIVYALGVEPVAVSHACDHPPAARGKPAVERSRVDPDAPAGTIHDQVLAADRGDGVYEVDLDALAAADPDLIVAQGVCEVCAVDEVLVREAAERLDLDPEILTVDPHRLADVFGAIERIGAALDRPGRAAALTADLRRRVERVEERVAGRPRPRVAVLDWLDPVMVAGHWVPDLVERAGGEYGLAAPAERSSPREWSAVRDYDPEVLVAAPCGFDVDRTLAEADDLTGRPGYADLAAVPDRAFAVDGNGHVNRPGPRLVDTLEALACLCHPDLADPPPDVARPLPAPAAEADP
ncbi:MAG: ABC transporter substrate-binding protein [Haloferacaceae archaeon]